MPDFEVNLGFACFLCQSRHNSPGLILSIGYGKGEQSGLVLRVELYRRGGYDETGWSLPFDEAWLDALRGLFHGLVANASL
jgi:hypothetical protein